MQTFLPYPDFAASSAVLDDRRLGKQRVEALQIVRPQPTLAQLDRLPPWLGDERVHRSHQAALVGKDAASYRPHFPRSTRSCRTSGRSAQRRAERPAVGAIRVAFRRICVRGAPSR